MHITHYGRYTNKADLPSVRMPGRSAKNHRCKKESTVDVVVRGAPVMRVLDIMAVGAMVVLVVVLVAGVVAVLVAMGVRVFVDVGMLVGVGCAVGMGVLMHVGVFVPVLMLVGRAFVVAVGVAVDTDFVFCEATAVLAHGALLYLLLIVCSLPIAASAFLLEIQYSQYMRNQGA